MQLLECLEALVDVEAAERSERRLKRLLDEAELPPGKTRAAAATRAYRAGSNLNAMTGFLLGIARQRPLRCYTVDHSDTAVKPGRALGRK
jgi:hypothetical protein